jgi:hypothetical protein
VKVGSALVGVLEGKRALYALELIKRIMFNTDLRERGFGRCGVDWSATG